MARLIDILRQEHRDTAVLLQALERQIDCFEAAGEPDYDVIIGAVDYFLDYPAKRHHPKEERLLGRLDPNLPAVAAVGAELRLQHLALGARLQRFRALLDQLLLGSDMPRAALVEAGRAFIADQRRHMTGEDEGLFLIAEGALGPDDWRELEEGGEAADPMAFLAAEAGYADVRKRLLAWANEFG